MSANMMYTAVSGLNTFNEALSVVSNNIANANTTAFKQQTVDFGNLVSGYMPTVYSNDSAQGVGSAVLSTSSDQSTGTEVQTGLWSDLMIQGSGYFEVQDKTNANVKYYTRDGAFQDTYDSTATKDYLTDMNGNKVMDSSGNAIDLTTYTNFSVDQYGNVYGVDTSGSQVSIAQIGVATFSNPNGLISDGNNLFSESAQSGAHDLKGPGNSTTQSGTLISGALEGSNVDLTQQMVNLINYQADYQANSKSVVTGNTLLQTVVNMIAG